ncbi:MAG: FAD-dependent oxidoreductase [Cyanobacteria bacterium P01_A01_bin.83]
MNKPLIVVVDDNREILHTVVRDLREQYGSSYRILSSDSGEKILKALPHLKLEQKPISLFLIDQRMPKMTGIEFLEAASPMFPNAKKVLLTAYADTRVAIEAINKAKIDYYLTKPWTPLEVNLYPVLDDLLEIWQKQQSQISAHEYIQILGSRHSTQTHQIKDFLASYHLPYRYRDLDQDREACKLMEMTNQDCTKLPLIIFPDGSQMICPSIEEIIAKVGFRNRSRVPFYDLIIISEGSAGLAAAICGSSAGLKTLLIEKKYPQEHISDRSSLKNYFVSSILTRQDLENQQRVQAHKLGVEIIASVEVINITVNNRYKYLSLSNNTKLSCQTLIVATGVSYRKLEISGISQLIGAGVYYETAISEAISCHDHDTYVVGGGNSAAQAAIYLANYARSVTILLKEESLAQTMSKYFVDRIKMLPNIKVKALTEVVAVSGTVQLETLTIVNLKTRVTETIMTNSLFVFIGAKPNTSSLQGVIECDLDGYIVTGNDLVNQGKQKSKWGLKRDPLLFETCIPGVFAIGDVRCNPINQSASAMGEGSIAVKLVHQYLSSCY